MKNVLKASELIAILQEKIKEVGDLGVTVYTQDGLCYDLRSKDDVNIVEWHKSDGIKYLFHNQS